MTIYSVDGCNNLVKHREYCSMHYQRWRNHGDPLKGRTPNGVQLKYVMDTINHANINECQIWPFSCDEKGYARIHIKGQGTVLLQRFVCEMMNGPQPSELLSNVAHSCGNGSLGCFNYLHLRWDTYSGNEADKLIHGTHNRGEQSGRHKLTENEVRMIRYFCDNNIISHNQLSKMFNISIAQVSRIRNRIDWSWLK